MSDDAAIVPNVASYSGSSCVGAIRDDVMMLTSLVNYLSDCDLIGIPHVTIE